MSQSVSQSVSQIIECRAAASQLKNMLVEHKCHTLTLVFLQVSKVNLSIIYTQILFKNLKKLKMSHTDVFQKIKIEKNCDFLSKIDLFSFPPP